MHTLVGTWRLANGSIRMLRIKRGGNVEMERNVPARAFKLLARSLASACLLGVGLAAQQHFDRRVVPSRAAVGDDSSATVRGVEPYQDPAYWGLKAGAYIPTDENCMGGTFAAGHNRHKQFDFETCAKVSNYGITLEEAVAKYKL